jgi:hypothetical protein
MVQKKLPNKLLEDHVYKKIDKLKKVDVVGGIPSCNNRDTIGKVISSFAAGDIRKNSAR